MATRRITQETFDAAVRENMEEFEMEPDEALREAVEQFESQGKVQDYSRELMVSILKEKATFSCLSWWACV